MTLVMKFGGTSVGDAAAVAATAVLIQRAQAAGQTVVVVVSAMGSQPVKVTDLLLAGVDADELRAIHATAVDALLDPDGERQAVLAEMEAILARYAGLRRAGEVLGELTPRALDAIAGMGEQMSARLLAAYLRQTGTRAQAVDATELIVTDDRFGAASPLWPETETRVGERLRPLLAAGVIPVVTGFIGATKAGVTTTLGRGGSDFSAAILGRALRADEVWIWTDVDGVQTADPRLVAGTQTIPQLTYREVAELAYYGAKVLHPQTIRPCLESGIPLRVKNTFNPAHPGTLIVPDAPTSNGAGLKAVTAVKELSLITVAGKGMLGVPGMAMRAFGAVALAQAHLLLISQASSEQSICFATQMQAAQPVIERLRHEFAPELRRRDLDGITAQGDMAIVTVVGKGLQRQPLLTGQVLTALGRRQVNVVALAQGATDCSLSLVVRGGDTETAVAGIHHLLVGHES
ncbi:MAG: aspartate kinase [Anaerolinea sp.]|nr:aspartate kinase [Anaerolinea sp.]